MGLIEIVDDIVSRRNTGKVVITDEVISELVSHIPRDRRVLFEEQLAFFPNHLDDYYDYTARGASNCLDDSAYTFSDEFLAAVADGVYSRMGPLEAGKLFFIHDKNDEALAYFKQALETELVPGQEHHSKDRRVRRRAAELASSILSSRGENMEAMVLFAANGLEDNLGELSAHDAEIALKHVERYWMAQRGEGCPSSKTMQHEKIAEFAEKHGLLDDAINHYKAANAIKQLVRVYSNLGISTSLLLTERETEYKAILDEYVSGLPFEPAHVRSFKESYVRASYFIKLAEQARAFELKDKALDYEREAISVLAGAPQFVKKLELIEGKEVVEPKPRCERYIEEPETENAVRLYQFAQMLPFGRLYKSLIAKLCEDHNRYKEGAKIFEGTNSYNELTMNVRAGNIEKVLEVGDNSGMLWAARSAAKALGRHELAKVYEVVLREVDTKIKLLGLNI